MEESALDLEIQSQKDREEAILREHKQTGSLSTGKYKKETSKSVLETRSGQDIKQYSTEKPYNSRAASKIALEIPELKEKEDELFKQREHVYYLPNGNFETLPAENNLLHVVNSSSINNTTEMTSHSSGSNVTPSLSLRKKDKINVQPLIYTEMEEEKPFFRLLTESPIERDIRLAIEREDELRKERGIRKSATQQRTEDRSHISTKLSSVRSFRPNSLQLLNGKQDIQKALATSRIQEEIEEQTQREISLRETGQIQTISQERTDEKVTRVRETVQFGNHTRKNFNSYRKSQNAVVKCSSPTIDKSPSHDNEKLNESRLIGLHKAQSPNSSSCSSSVTLSLGTKYISHNTTAPGINMQRLIFTRGKKIHTISPPAFKKPSATLSADKKNGYQTLNNRSSSVKTTTIKRKSINSIETKIQEELKEMKVREQELRLQRALQLGHSLPNLHLTNSDQEFNNENKKVIFSVRSNSNSNLVDNRNYTEKKDTTVRTPRRKSALIAQWEQMIKESES